MELVPVYGSLWPGQCPGVSLSSEMHGTRPSVSPTGTAPDHHGVNIDVFDSRYFKGHTQVTAWVFCQVQPTLPYLTCSKPEVVFFPKKHSSPVQPKIVPGNPPSPPLPWRHQDLFSELPPGTSLQEKESGKRKFHRESQMTGGRGGG